MNISTKDTTLPLIRFPSNIPFTPVDRFSPVYTQDYVIIEILFNESKVTPTVLENLFGAWKDYPDLDKAIEELYQSRSRSRL